MKRSVNNKGSWSEFFCNHSIAIIQKMAYILLRDGSFNLPVITNTQIVIQPFTP